MTLPRTVWPPHQGHCWWFKTRISNPRFGCADGAVPQDCQQSHSRPTCTSGSALGRCRFVHRLHLLVSFSKILCYARVLGYFSEPSRHVYVEIPYRSVTQFATTKLHIGPA